MTTITLDGYTFPEGELPWRGPLIELSEQVWSEQPTLGLTSPGTILTFMGTKSQPIPFEFRASSATANKLLAIHNAKKEVTLITPQNTDGFKVLLRKLKIEHGTPEAGSKYLCTGVLASREAASGATDPGAGGPPDEEDPMIVRKSVTETVNDSDVLQNDNELFFAIGANETWLIFFSILTFGVGSSDIKIKWVAPSGASADGNHHVRSTADVLSLAYATIGASYSFGTSASVVRPVVGSLLLVNGATAGNLQLQWAQNVAAVTETQVLVGSYLAAFRQ